MKFPNSAEDVEQEILISVGKYEQHQGLRIKQLAHVLQKANSEIIVEGVVRIFERDCESDNYAQQEFAGRILEMVRPKSQKDAKQLLQRGLKNWNKSVEQFPFWLRHNYGIDKLN
jgi:hypothetical protein